MRRLFRPFAVRLLTLAAAYGATLLFSGELGALGAGLLLFLLYAATALIWSFLDARKWGFRDTVLLWCLLALVIAPIIALGSQGAELDVEVLGADLVSFIPFMLALLGVPAVLGSGLGTMLRR